MFLLKGSSSLYFINFPGPGSCAFITGPYTHVFCSSIKTGIDMQLFLLSLYVNIKSGVFMNNDCSSVCFSRGCVYTHTEGHFCSIVFVNDTCTLCK